MPGCKPWGMTVALELLARGPSRPDLIEDLVVAETGLVDLLQRWSASAPVAVPASSSRPVPGTDDVVELALPSLDAVAKVLASGSPALVDVGPGLAGAGPAEDQLVDLLAVAAHSGVGFGSGLVPRVVDAEQVWALLSGAIAAITGANVRAALASPDPAWMLALPRAARETVRDVVTCVVLPAAVVDAVVADVASVPASGER